MNTTLRNSTPEEAVSDIQSHERVFVHGAAATPTLLLNALSKRSGELKNVRLIHLHLEGPLPHLHPAFQHEFRSEALFLGSNIRAAVKENRADFIPVFLSEAATLFQDNFRPVDTALLHLSTPDEHGFCSLGTSVDIALDASRAAKRRIALLNSKMPRTLGDGVMHISELHRVVYCDHPLPSVSIPTTDETTHAIGRTIAGLIEDGSTLQMGIGGIPNAVLTQLSNHKDLGIHTEMFSDGLLPLVEKGVITGKHKTRQRYKIVSSFVSGTEKLYQFVHNNPSVELRTSSDVNNPSHIAQQPKMIAINSAIEVDLTGQVCADSIGESIYSGVGGQMDFIRGASLSVGGKPIIALPSKTHHGLPRIVPILKQGAGVVTTRAHVHWVVTEHGAVNLFGLTLKERAQKLIALASPEHRQMLEEAAHTRFQTHAD